MIKQIPIVIAPKPLFRVYCLQLGHRLFDNIYIIFCDQSEKSNKGQYWLVFLNTYCSSISTTSEATVSTSEYDGFSVDTSLFLGRIGPEYTSVNFQ